MLSCESKNGGKRRTQAPVNGGRNYRTDHCSYVNKSGYMLKGPCISTYSPIHVALVTCNVQQCYVLSDPRDVPAYSQIYLRNYNGQSHSYGRHSLGLEFSASPTLRQDDASP